MIPMMHKGMMVAMKASEKTIKVAISPGVQDEGAYESLDKEQKAVLRYALVDFAKKKNMTISLFNCLKGTGEICWGYEAKTTRNRKPCLQLGLRKRIKA